MISEILIIHNPIAGGRRKKLLHTLVQSVRNAGMTAHVWGTEDRGSARHFAEIIEDVDAIIELVII